MGFLRKVCGVTKVRRCEIRKALSIVPLLWIERSQLFWFGHVSRMSQASLARHFLLATQTKKWSRIWQGPAGLTTSQPSSSCGASRTIWDFCWPWCILGFARAAAPATLPRRKSNVKMNVQVWASITSNLCDNNWNYLTTYSSFHTPKQSKFVKKRDFPPSLRARPRC